MPILTGKLPEATFGDLLGVSNKGQGLPTLLTNVQDGQGQNSPMQISLSAINFSRVGGNSFQLDGVSLTANSVDINSACNPNPSFSGTGALKLPVGNTAQRGTADDGKIRFNIDTPDVEIAVGGVWRNLAAGGTVTNIATGFGLTGGPITGVGTLSIDPAYVGQASIITLGAITTGTWNATTIAIVHGG